MRAVVGSGMRAGLLLLFLVTGTRAAIAEEPFDLAALLQRTGAIEIERANTTCHWTDNSRLEELDSSGHVKGAVIRTFSVTNHGPEPVSRTKMSERIEGDVSSLLREERPQQKGGDRRDRLSPFHPEASALYNIALVSHDARAVVMSFSPKQAADRRMAGTAELDPVSGRVLSLAVSPSKSMPMLDRLAMKLRFASTPCGNQPQVIESEGSGGFLFFKIRFHTRTELSGFEKVTSDASK